MKRRDLIKSGLLAAGAISVGLTGCTNNKNNKYEDIDIVPRQTDIYRISMPLPFDYRTIDEIIELNSKLKKSQIKTVYNSYPAPLNSIFEGEFQTNRGFNDKIKSFDDFAKYVKYAQDNGLKFVYTLNSPKPFSEDTFRRKESVLWSLLDKLSNIGVKEIKIANQQLMQIISNARPNFNLSASTSFEFHNISQFKNLINVYPNIKSINMAVYDNRNFFLLKNIRKLFPNVDIEIMVNLPCIKSCPSLSVHPAVDNWFNVFPCNDIIKRVGEIEFFFLSNQIYPYELEFYSAVGINSFKFIGGDRGNIRSLNFIKPYLECIENGIDNISVKSFFGEIMTLRGFQNVSFKDNLKLKDIIQYMPDIRHFVKKGHLCASICGAECNYCMSCAKKIREISTVS